MKEYSSFNRQPAPNFAEARRHFRDFEQLDPAQKAILLGNVEPMLNALIAKAFSVRSGPPAITGWTSATESGADGK
jgi:hypothetical protein